MPLPLILGIAAGVTAATGVGSGISGAVKMKGANDTMKLTKARHEKNLARFEKQSGITNKDMDDLGKFELTILESFERFAKMFEKIKNRPIFKEIMIEGYTIPLYDGKKINEVSVGAGVLLGGLGGAAVGTAGGFAAAGAATSAVMALGTASTGTAIASLSGAAATNATLAALGGGAVAAGGGGIALGTTMLGVTTAGVGLLVGGVIFNITGTGLSNKADEAYRQMEKSENYINLICNYLHDLSAISRRYYDALFIVNKLYIEHLTQCENLVFNELKQDWRLMTREEKIIIENTNYLVGLLYSMCKVNLVLQSKNPEEISSINIDDIKTTTNNIKSIIKEKNLDPNETHEIGTDYFNSFVNSKDIKEDSDSKLEKIICDRIKKLIKRDSSAKAYTRKDFINTKVNPKLKKALSTYAKKVDEDEVIAFIDTSLFENGGDGLLFSKYGVCFDYAFEKVYLKYTEIKMVTDEGKQIEFVGTYSNRTEFNNAVSPTLSDIYFNLSEVKKLIEDIKDIVK